MGTVYQGGADCPQLPSTVPQSHGPGKLRAPQLNEPGRCVASPGRNSPKIAWSLAEGSHASPNLSQGGQVASPDRWSSKTVQVVAKGNCTPHLTWAEEVCGFSQLPLGLSGGHAFSLLWLSQSWPNHAGEKPYPSTSWCWEVMNLWAKGTVSPWYTSANKYRKSDRTILCGFTQNIILLCSVGLTLTLRKACIGLMSEGSTVYWI